MIRITSFGYLHGEAPAAIVTLDVRTTLRDPYIDPALRQLTGWDSAVRDRVLNAPGAHSIVLAAVGMARSLSFEGYLADLAVGASRGRYRSVALANEIAHRLELSGFQVAVTHRDVRRPVVVR